MGSELIVCPHDTMFDALGGLPCIVVIYMLCERKCARKSVVNWVSSGYVTYLLPLCAPTVNQYEESLTGLWGIINRISSRLRFVRLHQVEKCLCLVDFWLNIRVVWRLEYIHKILICYPDWLLQSFCKQLEWINTIILSQINTFRLYA